MKILIDTRVAPAKATGMGYMVKNLVERIIDLSPDDHFTLIGELGLRKENVRHIPVRGFLIKRGLNFWWKTFGIPNVSWILGGFDIAFFPNYVDFPVSANKKIILVADVSYIYYPQFLEKKNLIFLRKYIPRAIKKADKVLTISQSVKDEILSNFNLADRDVVVLPLAANEGITARDAQSARRTVEQATGIRKPFILSFGTLEPRKNTISAIKAYLQLPGHIQDAYDLVIAGSKDRAYPEVARLIDECQAHSRIHVLGYVSDYNLASSLYSAASLFVNVSRYEGFGMPILEALKCGTKVLASDIPVFRETFAGMVQYTNPDDVSIIARDIEHALVVDEGARQERMRFADQFSWSKTAQRLLNVFREIHEDSN